MIKPISFLRVALSGSEPVTLAEAKTHCRVDHNDDDAKLTLNIRSAREMAENILRRRITTQTVDLIYDGFGDGFLYLDGIGDANVTALTVTYRNAAGSDLALPITDYEVLSRGGLFVRIKDSANFTLNAEYPKVVVRLTAGWDISTPAPVKDFILLIVESLYTSRGMFQEGALSPNPMAVGLLDPYVLPAV